MRQHNLNYSPSANEKDFLIFSEGASLPLLITTNEGLAEKYIHREQTENFCKKLVERWNTYDELVEALKIAKMSLKEVAPDAYKYGSVGMQIDEVLNKINGEEV